MSVLHSLSTLLNNAEHLFNNKPAQSAPQPAPQQPNFYFQKGTNGSEYNFIGGAPPVKQDINVPQNLNAGAQWSQYGDNQGNRWMENNDTGQKVPFKPAPLPFDAPIPRVQTMPGEFTLPIQYQNQNLRTPHIGTLI